MSMNAPDGYWDYWDRMRDIETKIAEEKRKGRQEFWSAVGVSATLVMILMIGLLAALPLIPVEK